MTLIISENGKNAKRIEKSSFDKEDYLQKYIYNNPDSIPIYQVKEDARLLILAREFPTNSGPIDAIGVDKDGEIYIIETKLYENADKRKVVAQALDYGAALWKHANDYNEFIDILSTHTQKTFNLSLTQKIQEFFEATEEDVEVILDNIKRNLSDGSFRFVILMDRLDSRLKDLILFVNQNSQFDIYAVELEYYKHEKQEIIIPRIFGAEVKKDIGVKSSKRSGKKWNEETLLEDAKRNYTPEQYEKFEKFYYFCKEHAKINFGSGACGSYSPIFNPLSEKSLFTFYTSSIYSLSLNFEWLAKGGYESTAILFKEKLEKIGLGVPFPSDYLKKRPTVDWSDKSDDLINIIQEMLDEKSPVG